MAKIELFGYILTCTKRKKKRSTGFSSKRWSASEINTALRLKGEGKSNQEIADMLHRTVPAVAAKLGKVHNV